MCLTLTLAVPTQVARAQGGLDQPGESDESVVAEVAEVALAPETQGSALVEALRSGESWLNLRARYERVDDDAFKPKANAATLRTALGYRTGAWTDLQAMVEFESVTNLGNDSFNSTANGATGKPVVADPESTEINQAMLTWKGLEGAEVWLGRRRIKLDNDRFIGNVGWRQNEQTYDSAGVELELGEQARLFYAYLHNVNRIFGDQSPVGDDRMDSHLLNLAGDLEGIGRLVGYWYLIDSNSPASLDGFSTSTVGGRLKGSREFDALSLLYTAEFAAQRDAGDNPNDVDADYALAQLGAQRNGVTLRLGYELLGGSGDPGDKFTTPLATLYAHNGWADRFLATPDTGLEDLSISLDGTWRELDWSLSWHEFSADTGSADYGTELDAGVGFNLTKTVRAGTRLAIYEAEDFSTDTTKFWFWLSTSLLP